MANQTFQVAVTSNDPLTAERLVDVLVENGIDAFSRARGAASSDAFAAAGSGYWEVFVPSADDAKAAPLIRAELTAIEHDAAANAQAAEEEALSGETPTAE